MKKCIYLMVIPLILSSFVITFLQAQTGHISKYVIGGGGVVGIQNTNGFTINSQIGQSVIFSKINSNQGSSKYLLNQGFWIPLPIINTDVEKEIVTINKEFYNYPNPVTTNTTIEFNLNTPSLITLKVYDMIGNEVKLLYDGYKSSGIQKMEWNTKGDNGLDLPAGSYIYELQIRSTDIIGASSFRSYVLRNIMIIVR